MVVVVVTTVVEVIGNEERSRSVCIPFSGHNPLLYICIAGRLTGPAASDDGIEHECQGYLLSSCPMLCFRGTIDLERNKTGTIIISRVAVHSPKSVSGTSFRKWMSSIADQAQPFNIAVL